MDFPMYISRKDMERKLDIVQELGRQRQLRFYEDASQVVNSLLNIRPTPNGRYNLLTVDELVRTTLLMADHNFESENPDEIQPLH